MSKNAHIDELSKAFEALSIPTGHVTVGLSNLIASNNQFRILLKHRRLPEHGWSDLQIQSVLLLLATLDTNNKSNVQDSSNSDGDTRWVGVGEREGRCYSSLVMNRHYGLAHGMGRSGDIAEPQPKAVGSTILVKLTTSLVLDAMRRACKLTSVHSGVVLPLCTGMSMSLVLTALKKMQTDMESNAESGDRPRKNKVLWSRIDQKSCFKAILSAGFECVIVPTVIDGDAVVTDLDAMKYAIKEHGVSSILAVITTTSCFAPRVPDRIDEVARICQQYDIPHVINNAYGLQSTTIAGKLVNRACVVGRVDAIICSTDKNFLVPVGGAVVVAPKERANVIKAVGQVYAGRASSSPLVDLFITLLSMGLSGYQRLLQQRQDMLSNFRDRFAAVAAKHGERLLQCYDRNDISFGMTLDTIAADEQEAPETDNDGKANTVIQKQVTSFGSMLFRRCVSGTRVVAKGENKTMSGHDFIGFGSSTNDYPHHYMTAACAIGLSPVEVDEFFVRLDKTLTECKKKGKKVKS